MAKLNKTEISAIVAQVADNIESKNEEYNKKLKEKEFSKWKTKFLKSKDGQRLKSFCEESKHISILTKKLSWSNRIDIFSIENILVELFEKENSLEYKYIDKNLVQRDLIIQQAQGADVEQLIKDLTKKYSI